MFDVGDIPVLTFGNCVLKTAVITWPLKLYVRFLRFSVFSKFKIHEFLRFLELLHRFSRTLVHRYTTASAKYTVTQKKRINVLCASLLLSNQIKSLYSLIQYKYVLHMTVHELDWTNEAIKLLQLPKKQNINQKY